MVYVPFILASGTVPDDRLDAFRVVNPEPEPLNVPALNVLLLGLYDKLSSTAIVLPAPSLSVNVRYRVAFVVV